MDATDAVEPKPKYEKLSKKNQTREEEEAAKQWRIDNPPKKSQHFAINTYVVRLGVRGLITAISKDGGKSLCIEWDDGTVEVIPSPLWRNRV